MAAAHAYTRAVEAAAEGPPAMHPGGPEAHAMLEMIGDMYAASSDQDAAGTALLPSLAGLPDLSLLPLKLAPDDEDAAHEAPALPAMPAPPAPATLPPSASMADLAEAAAAMAAAEDSSNQSQAAAAAAANTLPDDQPTPPVPRLEDGTPCYPPAEATHEEVIADYGLFMRLLQRLHNQMQSLTPSKGRRKAFKVPTVYGQQLDLQVLYRQITNFGGMESVMNRKKWTKVCEPFKFPPTFTNKSFAIRKIATQLSLGHFEQVYFHRMTGPIQAQPGTVAVDGGGKEARSDGEERPPKRRRPSKAAAAAAAAAGGQRQREGSPTISQQELLLHLAGEWQQAGQGGQEGQEVEQAGHEEWRQEDEEEDTDEWRPRPQQRRRRTIKQEDAGAVAGFPALLAPAAAPQAADAVPTVPKRRGRARKRATADAGQPPALMAFLQQGSGGGGSGSLVGQAISGTIDAKFDCGYFCTLRAGGQEWRGILYSFPGPMPPPLGSGLPVQGNMQQPLLGAGQPVLKDSREPAGAAVTLGAADMDVVMQDPVPAAGEGHGGSSAAQAPDAINSSMGDQRLSNGPVASSKQETKLADVQRWQQQERQHGQEQGQAVS